jgi:hypothetical protein
MAYTYIENLVSYVWVLAQLEPITEEQLAPELLDQVHKGEL